MRRLRFRRSFGRRFTAGEKSPLERLAVLLMLVGLVGGVATWLQPYFPLLRNGGISALARVMDEMPAVSFDAVPLARASTQEREAALIFRSILPSVADEQNEEGRWLSLNLLDESQAPVIFDGERGAIRKISSAYASAPEGGGQVLEIGAFSRGLAPVKALVAAGKAGEIKAAWGYVDVDGHWAIPPSFSEASTFVNGVALVAEPEQGRAGWRLIDPQGNVLRRLDAGKWRIEPLGRQALLSADGGGGTFLLAEATMAAAGRKHESAAERAARIARYERQMESGQSEAAAERERVPGRIERADPSGSLAVVAVYRNGPLGHGLFRAGRGMVLEPDGQRDYHALTPLLSDTYAEAVYERDQRRYYVYSIESRQPLASGLSAIAPLLADAFVACAGGTPAAGSASENAWRFPFTRSAQCGLMDAQGHWRLKPEYHSILKTSAGRLRLGKGNVWCIAEPGAELHVQCSESPAAPLLSAGLMPDVDLDSGRLGYRDAKGAWVSPPKFRLAGEFMGRVAKVRQQGVEGLIDPAGNWLTPMPPQSVAVSAWENQAKQTGYRSARTGVIDRRGNWVLPAVFHDVRGELEKGEFRGCTGIEDIECPLLDIAGRRLPEPKPEATPPEPASTRGDAAITVPDLVPSARNGLWGYADQAGKWIIAPRFADAEEFSDGLAAVAESAGGAGLRWGYVDRQGRVLVPPSLDEAMPFSRGVAWVRKADRWGLIDSRGKWLVEPRFYEYLASEREATWARDDLGLYLVKPGGVVKALQDVKEIAHFGEDSLAPASDGSKWGYIDLEGNWVIPARYAGVQPFAGEYALVTADSSADWQPPKGEGSPYLVRQIRLWRAGGVAAVAVLDKGKERLGLVDRDGRWLLPKLP